MVGGWINTDRYLYPVNRSPMRQRLQALNRLRPKNGSKLALNQQTENEQQFEMRRESVMGCTEVGGGLSQAEPEESPKKQEESATDCPKAWRPHAMYDFSSTIDWRPTRHSQGLS